MRIGTLATSFYTPGLARGNRRISDQKINLKLSFFLYMLDTITKNVFRLFQMYKYLFNHFIKSPWNEEQKLLQPLKTRTVCAKIKTRVTHCMRHRLLKPK